MQPPLDIPTMRTLGEYSSHPCVQAGSNAWRTAYDLAHQLAFTEAAALRQADTAWDRTAELWRQVPASEPVCELTELSRRGFQLED